jgi:hypothetical protein
MSDSETHRRGKLIIENKEHMLHVLSGLENENLVMFSEEDGTIVMI